MSPFGVVEALLLLALLIAATIAVVVVRRVVFAARARRASPLDRMPEAWLEQRAMADQSTDRPER